MGYRGGGVHLYLGHGESYSLTVCKLQEPMGFFDYRFNIHNTSLTPPSDQVCGSGQGGQAISEYMHRWQRTGENTAGLQSKHRSP